MSSEVISEERRQWLWDQQEALLDRVAVSASYHGKRERFFGMVERVLQALTAIAATSAFADIVPANPGPAATNWRGVLALIAAVASILPLVFGFADRARTHGQLRSDFKKISAEMYSAGLQWDEPQLATFRSKVAAIEAGEPPALAALVIQCQNELAASRQQHCFTLSGWERLLMHFYGFDSKTIIDRTPRPTSPADQDSAN